MAIITMPANLACGTGCTLEQVSTDSITRSDVTGTVQARSYGAPVWSLTLASPDRMSEAQAAQWKALGLQLRGAVNLLAAFDPSRPVPLGTARGAMTLASGAVAGASSISITSPGQAGKTLKVGDLLQIGTGHGSSELVMVTQDVVFDGLATAAVPVEPPLRRAYSAGTPITWDKPRMYARRTEGRFGWGSGGFGITRGMTLQLIEGP